MSKKQSTEIVPASEVAEFEKGTTKLTKIAGTLTITTPADENNAYDFLKKIKTLKKEVEDKRTAITGPLNASLKAANALFKPLTTSLKEADTIVRGKILDFQDEQEEKATKQQAVRDKVQATKEAKGIETEALAEVVPDVGETTVAKRWAYDLIDIGKVPCQYLALNRGIVWEAICSGVRDIPGLKIYQEKGVQVRD